MMKLVWFAPRLKIAGGDHDALVVAGVLEGQQVLVMGMQFPRVIDLG